jgi:hypothetical protein
VPNRVVIALGAAFGAGDVDAPDCQKHTRVVRRGAKDAGQGAESRVELPAARFRDTDRDAAIGLRASRRQRLQLGHLVDGPSGGAVGVRQFFAGGCKVRSDGQRAFE